MNFQDNQIYKALVETIDQGFCVIEVLFDQKNRPYDYRFLEKNPAFEEQTGLTNPIGKTMLEMVPTMELHWFELYGKVALTGEPVRFTERSEGMDRWFECYGFRIGSSDSRKVGVLFTDVTKRRQFEEALKESEIRFRAIADDAPVFIFLAGENAEVEYLNKTWQEYTGIFTEDSKGRAWAEITHPDDVVPATDIYMEGFVQRKSCTFENRQKGTDGIYRSILWKANPRFSPNGIFIGMMGVGTDINEQKKAFKELEVKNAQLLKINNDLDNFIYTASHDLKAPVSNIEGLLNALRDSFQEKQGQIKDEYNDLLEMMEKSVVKFKETILDLTEISKVQKSDNEDLEQINLVDVLEDVKESIGQEILKSRAVISYDFSQAKKISFSKKNIKSIIYNLLSNAIKYRDDTREADIHIFTERLPNYILLSVKDNGLGIEENNKTKIFTMFKRFHSHVDGTGIGLYIVKRIIDNAGGKIEVESEIGAGSCFKVYFPLL